MGWITDENDLRYSLEELRGMSRDDIAQTLLEKAEVRYEAQRQLFGESFEEIERVVDYVKQSGEAEYSQDVMDKIEQAVKEKEKGGGKSAGAPEPAGESPDDELLSAAVDVVLETGQASVSMLQRRLKLGYARAARLVDQMEERGYVGPFEGSKPRQLLIDKAKWQELKMAKAPAPEPEIDRNGSIRDVFESRDALD